VVALRGRSREPPTTDLVATLKASLGRKALAKAPPPSKAERSPRGRSGRHTGVGLPVSAGIGPQVNEVNPADRSAIPLRIHLVAPSRVVSALTGIALEPKSKGART
jgi:hypothetical protein